MRCGTVFLMVGCLMLLSGCASLNPMPFGAEQHQQDALARWQQCLNRHTADSQSTKIHEVASELQLRCDGHRRDVLMSFPEPLEPQLDAMLREQTFKSAFGEHFKRPIGLSGRPARVPISSTVQGAH